MCLVFQVIFLSYLESNSLQVYQSSHVPALSGEQFSFKIRCRKDKLISAEFQGTCLSILYTRSVKLCSGMAVIHKRVLCVLLSLSPSIPFQVRMCTAMINPTELLFYLSQNPASIYSSIKLTGRGKLSNFHLSSWMDRSGL